MPAVKLQQAEIDDADGYLVSSGCEFDFLSEEYQRLYARSCATTFQSPEWLHVFYKTLAPALGADPVITTLRNKLSGELRAVLPFVRQNSMGAKILQSADLGISDYNQLVAPPHILEDAASCPGIAQQIVDQIKPFDALIVRKQRADGFCISKLFRQAVTSPNENSAYEVKVEPDFDTWLTAAVSKNFRSSFRRKQRRFIKDHGDLSFDLVTKTKDIDAAFEFMRTAREKRFADDLFCRDEYFAFYREFAELTAKSGKSFTFVSYAKGQIVAVEFGLLEQAACLMVHGAFDPKFPKYSLGNISLINLVRHLRSIGLNHFDFTIGDHDYKKSFTACEISLTNAVLANTALGKLVGVTYRHGGGLKRLLGKLNPNLN